MHAVVLPCRTTFCEHMLLTYSVSNGKLFQLFLYLRNYRKDFKKVGMTYNLRVIRNPSMS